MRSGGLAKVGNFFGESGLPFDKNEFFLRRTADFCRFYKNLHSVLEFAPAACYT